MSAVKQRGILMLDTTNFAELEALGAEITTSEIKQQPDLWEGTLDIYLNNREKMMLLLVTSEARRTRSCSLRAPAHLSMLAM